MSGLGGRTIALTGLEREELLAVSAAIESAHGDWQAFGRASDPARLRAFDVIVCGPALLRCSSSVPPTMTTWSSRSTRWSCWRASSGSCGERDVYGSRTLIWTQTLAVMAGYVAAIAVVHRLVLRSSLSSRALALAIAFSIVQAVAILLMLFVLLTRRGLAGRRTRRSRELAAAAQAAVAEHAAGMDRLPRGRRLGADAGPPLLR